MGHNKMYREILGYEDALYGTTESMDDLEDLYELIQYVKSKPEVIEKLDEIQQKITRIKNSLV